MKSINTKSVWFVPQPPCCCANYTFTVCRYGWQCRWHFFLISFWVGIFTIICASSPFLFIKINRMQTYPDLKSSVDRAGCTQAICIICQTWVNLQQAGWEVIFFFQCGLVDVEGGLLHYLALGSLLFMFLWLVRLLRTQLLASEASLELIAPFLCSQLHSSPSSSGSSSSSSTSLSTSLRSSRSTCGEENTFNKTSSWCRCDC